ncbi:hypothetical protein ACKWTF_002038 [Chironomus riparius]
MEMDNFVYMNYKVFLKAEQIKFFGSINFFFVPFFSFSFLYVKKKSKKKEGNELFIEKKWQFPTYLWILFIYYCKNLNFKSIISLKWK